MAQGPYVLAQEFGSARIFVADSVTYFTALEAPTAAIRPRCSGPLPVPRG
jgi:hypothetical protein